ncbi:ABC transporter ATP-binding protein [Oenococcus oeni]|uniref:ABC transporter ATP-binding protein n=1 Tax=Oenococcus oeni TaxID=1247 RepID=UPI001C5AFEA2|nr:ABC transporter ATP-binding protein [Oenococcus oeni]
MQKEADTAGNKYTTWQMLRFVFGEVLHNRWILILNVVALTIITMLQFVIPQIEQFIIDSVIPKKDFSWLIGSTAVLLLTAVFLGLLNYFSVYYMGVLSQSAITELRNKLYHQIIQLDTHFFESSKTGDLMTRLTGDVSNLQNLISSNMLSIIGNFFTFIGVWAFIFYVNWQMALAVSLTFPFMFIIYRVFRGRIHTAFRAARRSQSDMSNQMQNTLTQIELIKSYASENLEEERFEENSNRNKRDLIQATHNMAIFSPLVDLVNYIGTAIILTLGAYFVIHDQLTVGQLVAYLSYVSLLQNPIRSLTSLLNQLQESLVSYGRIMDINQVKSSIVEDKGAINFPKISRGINLENVSFAYEKEETIHDITFSIPFGKTTALVGRSGSGKTTITKLIDRLYDLDNGLIKFDGLDIKKIKLRSLRENIAIVSQDTYIVDGTIKDNIIYGKQGASEEDIWRVAEMADIADFIHQQTKGMNTLVGERGVKLSGGQKQRISIARALLKDAPIVILDEATASLDNESEKNIQHALKALMKNRTSLVIAHRLSTIYNADQIIVMNQGRIVERGKHEQLLKQNGSYARLYNAQFK